VLPIERQVEELMGWLRAMADQIPGSDGLLDGQRAEEAAARNAAVLTV
jgi:transcription-repair coupling factor (superfamily II helicase)